MLLKQRRMADLSSFEDASSAQAAPYALLKAVRSFPEPVIGERLQWVDGGIACATVHGGG
jgi:hypothetical protein